MFARLMSAASAAVLLAVAVPAAAQTPAPPPVEAYGRLPALAQVRLSPDGDKVAFIAQVGEQRRLGVQSIDGKPIALIGLGEQNVVDVRWGGPKHVLITTRQTKAIPFVTDDIADFFNTQSYNIETKKFVTLLDRMTGLSRAGGSSRTGEASGFNVVVGLPEARLINGQWKIFVGGLVQGLGVGRFEVDPDTGIGTLLRRANGVTDENGNVIARASWDQEDKFWRLTAVEEDGRLRELHSHKGALTGQAEDTPQLYGRGRTPGTVLVSLPEGDFPTLYEFDLKTGAKEALNFGADRFGEAFPMYHGPTGRLLGFQFTGLDKPTYLWTDRTAGQAIESIRLAFPNDNVTIPSFTPDYTKVVAYTDGPNDAGTYRFVDMAARKAIPIASAYPGAVVSEKKWISYKAQDGLEIFAYLTLPRGREAKNLPLVVLPHGGPQARDEAGFDWWSQAIASRGYAVLQPQFRGSDGFGKAFVQKGYGQWGKAMQTDLSDGVRHLAAQGVIDPKRVCINGWSYGGYAAMAGPTLDPGVYRCSIAGAGVSDMRRMMLWVKDQSGGQRDTPALRYWRRYMDVDRTNDRSLDAIAPAVHADKVDGPMLLLHGDLDTVVPLEQSQFMADALKKAGKPHEFVVLKGEDHNISRGRTRLQMLKATLDWLEKHNPAN